MKYAVYLPNFGDHAAPDRLVELAQTAEQSGWDGLFLWDHIQQAGRSGIRGASVADPWISLAAIAQATERIRLGPLVTPLARRRPWKVAREIATLDRLAEGRTIFGAGLGAPPEAEFAAFGENPDPRVRAEKLDEGLEILRGLLSGEPFSHRGTHYQLDDVWFSPSPLQAKVPIWLAGIWPSVRPFERAARFDGVFPLQRKARGVSAAELAEIAAFAKRRRPDGEPFDLIAGGRLRGETDAELSDRQTGSREAGATWWLDWLGTDEATYADTLAAVERGPLRS